MVLANIYRHVKMKLMARYCILLRSLSLLVATLLIWPAGQSQEVPRSWPQQAFQVGEELRYRIHYGPVTAGRARIAVEGLTRRAGRPVYQAVGTGRSVGMTDWFFKVRDRYETYIDTQALLPWEFVRDVQEGGYTIKRHLIFNQTRQRVFDRKAPAKDSFALPPFTQDLFSAFYFARSLRTDTLQVGEVIRFPVFLDHKMFPFNLQFKGRTSLDTKWGRVPALRFEPAVQEGRVFESEESMTLWVSDDANQVPLLIRSQLMVGSIKVALSGFKGLRHRGVLR